MIEDCCIKHVVVLGGGWQAGVGLFNVIIIDGWSAVRVGANCERVNPVQICGIANHVSLWSRLGKGYKNVAAGGHGA